ncbi:MAG: calcium/sodium antiporter [Candidatus Tectimicrobiota bacterium]
MDNYLLFLGGVIAAGAGGEVFIRGAVGIAHWARIPAGIIGATVAAFATSSPECAVAVSAALAGTPEIALGDALGSNVVNVALILGLVLLLADLQAPRNSLKRDFPIAMLAPGLLAVLAFDGLLSRLDGLLLLGVFGTWLIATALEARRQRSAAEHVLGEYQAGRALGACLLGLLLLIVAGRLIVSGAVGVAQAFGLSEFVIGATVVAIGTSMPELATALIAKLRGHDEIGLGTILGSNIFNGLWIVAVTAIITPIPVSWRTVGVGLGFGMLTVACLFPGQAGWLTRKRGALLLALYIVYVGTILTQHTA